MHVINPICFLTGAYSTHVCRVRLATMQEHEDHAITGTTRSTVSTQSTSNGGVPMHMANVGQNR